MTDTSIEILNICKTCKNNVKGYCTHVYECDDDFSEYVKNEEEENDSNDSSL